MHPQLSTEIGRGAGGSGANDKEWIAKNIVAAILG
jgi:hypothetical protein